MLKWLLASIGYGDQNKKINLHSIKVKSDLYIGKFKTKTAFIQDLRKQK